MEKEALVTTNRAAFGANQIPPFLTATAVQSRRYCADLKYVLRLGYAETIKKKRIGLC